MHQLRQSGRRCYRSLARAFPDNVPGTAHSPSILAPSSVPAITLNRVCRRAKLNTHCARPTSGNRARFVAAGFRGIVGPVISPRTIAPFGLFAAALLFGATAAILLIMPRLSAPVPADSISFAADSAVR